MAENSNLEKYDDDVVFEGDSNLDALEAQLNADLEEQMEDLSGLEKDFEKIGSPDALGDTVMNVVWEQFINQVGVVAGEDFIKENRGLKLDLRDSAHIQTTENFAEGNIATHNTKIDYQKRYDDWQNNFARVNGDPEGEILTRKDYRSGEERPVLRTYDSKQPDNYNKNYDARGYIDYGRPSGSASMHKDHTIPAAEIIRDAEANAHLSREEQAAFANSDVNLVDLDASANESKRDSSMTEWLDSERNGQKPAERFNIDETELRERDKKAREAYEKEKTEGEKRSIEAGKQSRKEEAFRIGGKALRAAIMGLLAELIKKIIQKLVSWFRSANRKMGTLIESIKEAIHDFINNMKTNFLNAGNTLLTSVATAIFGPIIGTLKKAWIFLKQGYKSLKEAINYIKEPKNRKKSFSILMLEVGKIVIAGLTAGGAILLGEAIEKGLSTFPIFAIQIPLLGSLANILGIFLGAVISGIIGAIALNLIDKAIANKQKRINVGDRLAKEDEILNTQTKLVKIGQIKEQIAEEKTITSIQTRHEQFGEAVGEIAKDMKDSVENIDKTHEKNNNDFDQLQNMLDNI
ncbi:MAG: ABC transporter permease [Bacteroidaceae bacterium]|nr:ABC transporter permease [Bacteroidaceae bacterium]